MTGWVNYYLVNLYLNFVPGFICSILFHAEHKRCNCVQTGHSVSSGQVRNNLFIHLPCMKNPCFLYMNRTVSISSLYKLKTVIFFMLGGLTFLASLM